uniref:Protein lifeguard 2 n=1 Tax=Chelonoidis abingdonii TaxID=106734 RepID=A0A8C0GHR6_CHEAB
MTQGKLSVNNKPPNSEGQQGQGEKKDNATAPSAPPTYEEATSGEGMKTKVFSPPPSVPLHPSWAYVDPSASPNYGSGGYPGDTELLTTFNWDDKNVRRVFVRKVPPGTASQRQVLPPSPILCLVLLSHSAVFFVTYLILACCSGPRYNTSFCFNYYNTTSVLLCLGITALVCLSVTIFSFQTKFDFTSCQGVLFIMLMVLLFSGIILAILLPFQYVPWLQAIYAVLGAIVFTMFLAFDTQLLMGNRRYSLSPEEYIFGALNIYLDIVYIFSFFLQLFGSSRE